MQNNNYCLKHHRGSSRLHATEQRQEESVMFPAPKRTKLLKELLIDTSESVSDNWVRGLRSIRKDEKESTSRDKKKKLISHEDDAETKSADERWLDDGGVSGEEVR